MITIINLVNGPFKNETEYKHAELKRLSFLLSGRYDFVCLETEETEPGMPDVMKMSTRYPWELIEYKISNARGVIKFRKDQLRFYRIYGPKGYRINVHAWDVRTRTVVEIGWEEVIAGKSLTMQLYDDGLMIADAEALFE